MTSSVPFLVFPGVAGNFIETADTNLFDADSAHIQQGLGGWGGGSGAAIALDTAQAYFGDSSMKATCNGGSNVMAAATGPTLPAGEHTFSIWAYTAVADREAFVRFDGTFSAEVALTPGVWTQISITKTVGAGAPAIELRFRVASTDANPSNGDEVFFDAASVRSGPDGGFVPSLRIVGEQLETRFDGTIANPGGVVAYHFTRGFATAPGSHHWMLSAFQQYLYVRLSDGTNGGFDRYDITSFQDGNRHLWVAKAQWSGSAWSTIVEIDGDTQTVELANLASVGFPLNALNVGTGASPVSVGALTTGNEPYGGSVWEAEVRDGIDGPVVARMDASDAATATVT